MPSERKKLEVNENESANTRMDITRSMASMDFRKDELMHIGRYMNACKTAINLSQELGRPINILDLGCGEIYTMQTLYKSFTIKKSEVVKRYIGVDIDGDMLEKTKEKREKVLNVINCKLIAQDLTVDPVFQLKSNSIDLVVWFEMIEHIKPKFVKPIMDEVYRVVNPKGAVLVSTPNANGSNKKLPKDHVYEWSYEELKEVIEDIGFNIIHASGTSINPSRIPKNVWDKRKKQVEAVYHSFGENTAFSCVALSPLFPVKYSKNMLFKLKKGE